MVEVVNARLEKEGNVVGIVRQRESRIDAWLEALGCDHRWIIDLVVVLEIPVGVWHNCLLCSATRCVLR